MATPEWSRILNTTIHQFVREEEVNILRNRKVLALLQKRGRISFNHSGDRLDWKVRYKRSPMQGYADTDTLTFSRQERWKTAQLEYRGYSLQDSVTEKERLMNRSTEAIIKFYSQLATMMMDDMEDQFSEEVYTDGGAAGNSKRYHGIETFMGSSGPAANGFVALPNSTYADLVCTLGNYSGAWSTTGGNIDWPSGRGDAHFDFWSPIIVDYTDTAWAASTKTWPNTCKEALSYGIIKSRRNKGKKGLLDLIVLDGELYRQLWGKLEPEERLVVERGGGEGMYSLGFGDTITLEGCEITWEYGVPASVGYGFSMENMEIRAMYDTLFKPKGPDEDIATQSYRFAIMNFGNFLFNPRYFCKFQAVT